jgi:ketosteroid isomerase-like protein
MSEENVAIVRRIYDAYAAGDFETAFELIDPAVEFDGTVRPEGGMYYGHPGLAEALRTWTGTWESWRLELEQVVDADPHVVAIERQSGRGKGSGLRWAEETATLFTLREGKVVRMVWFVSRGAALEAAGLPE